MNACAQYEGVGIVIGGSRWLGVLEEGEGTYPIPPRCPQGDEVHGNLQALKVLVRCWEVRGKGHQAA